MFKQIIVYVGLAMMAMANPAGSQQSPQNPTGHPLRIGASASLTGKAYSVQGNYVRDGYLLCQKHVNAQGGVLGREIEFVIYDDESDEKTAARLYEKLITEDKVDAVLGPYGTQITEAVADIPEKHHKLMIAPTAATSSIWQKDLVSAWASDQGLVLGQREVDGKSNEITAIPKLLDTLHLDGAIVTLDAMGCQKDIAARIRAKGADYLLALKANHGRAFEAACEHFERTCFSRGAGGRPACDAFDDSHGRLVRRRVFVNPAIGELEPLHEWPDLRALLAVETIRSVNGTGKTETEIRYFLTSCNDDPAVLAQAIRRHWSRTPIPRYGACAYRFRRSGGA